MEVAGQWRRQWAGTAEYGKVTEGGVTRRVARAMEVLHASGPGARVRVMRAAYHSTAGPGAPASSYLVHSSRQVLSSGYNFLEPSPLRSKPLEISSTPLETSPDSEAEKEDYKVTEPDDYDISEPSKWRGSSRNNPIRMPSEESSSTDNASVIDLDSRASSRNTPRRSIRDKENYDLHRIHNINTRISPLLDAPVALSTLKYTSILSGTDDWNTRRKSYSFEDTSPIDTISPGNNLSTMESSTDSGICKSTEVVNDYLHNASVTRYSTDKMDQIQEETFKDWLSRNKSYSYTRATPPKSREDNTNSQESKITLQPSGKVTITLPKETYADKQMGISKFTDESDRKSKKVEFCKTELHFAVDTGTVNIIATDEKPPPSNDFRRRRSAFIPLNDKIDRSITLFGENNDTGKISLVQGISNSEFGESDENTAATKSILKNKIPKPKPYLLGENMDIGFDIGTDDSINDRSSSNCKSSGVSLINSQLAFDSRSSNETVPSCTSDSSSFINYRTENKGPRLRNDIRYTSTGDDSFEKINSSLQNLKILQLSPTPNRTKLRELRDTELAYFGVKNDIKTSPIHHSQENLQEEIFHSVKLVQQISNSVCNSEAESDDSPEYQNIIPKYSLQVTPTPKPRSKYGEEAKPFREPKVLKPILEQDMEKSDQINRSPTKSRRSKDPIKTTRTNGTETLEVLRDKASPIGKKYKVSDNILSEKTKGLKSNKENDRRSNTNSSKQDRKKSLEPPLYVNLKFKPEKKVPLSSSESFRQKKAERPNSLKIESNLKTPNGSVINEKANLEKYDTRKTAKKIESSTDVSQNLIKQVKRRTEKLTTPDEICENKMKLLSHKDKNSPTRTSMRHSKFKISTSETSEKKENKNESKINEIPKSKKEKHSISSSSENTKEIARINKKLSQQPDNINENVLRSRDIKGVELTQRSSKHNTNVKNYNNNNNEKVPTSTKMDKSSKSKRSKYVINYDDKNGTVSSICKIKTGPGTYKRKLISVENKNAQECDNINDKSLNKIALRK